MKEQDPGDILKAEHEEIGKLLSALDGMAAHILEEDRLPDEYLEKAFAVAVEFADKCHHEKEEKALFPVLSESSPKIGGEMARRLTSDHRAFRKLLGGMLDLISSAMIKKESMSILAKQIATYTRLLREHMKVEEERMIPEVERNVSPAKRAEISEKFKRLEEETVGHVAHEKYVRLIADLNRRFGTKA